MPRHEDDGEHEADGVPLNVVAFVGLAYREAKERYRHDVESDLPAYLRATIAGSMRTDQNRFNVMGEFGAIYLSLDAETPLRELRRTYLKQIGADRPEDISVDRILITLALHLCRVADLRDPTECAQWGIAPGAVQSDDLTPCQAVAREARRTHEAIRYPSATGRGENLALFFDRLLPESHVTLLDVRSLDVPWKI